MSEEVHWLHRRVREKWTLILALDHFCSRLKCSIYISILAPHLHHRSIGTVQKILKQLIVVNGTLYIPFFFVFDLEQLSRFIYLPCRFSYNCDIVLKRNYVDDTR